MIILLTWIKPPSSNLVCILAKKLLTMILRRSLIFVDSMLTCRLGSCLPEAEIKVSLLITSTIMYCLKVNFVIYASDTAFNPLMTIVLKEIKNYLKIFCYLIFSLMWHRWNLFLNWVRNGQKSPFYTFSKGMPKRIAMSKFEDKVWTSSL